MIEYIPIVCLTVDSANEMSWYTCLFLLVALTFGSLILVLGHH